MLQQTSPSPTGLTAGAWLVDPNAGRIAFAVKTMWGLATVKGTFGRFEGALQVTDEGATGELVVHTDSLDTKNKKRDEHLRSADFFDAASHPRVTFTTQSVVPTGGGFLVGGELVVGTTRTALQLPVEVAASTADAIVLRTETAIRREDVGLTWNKVGMIKGDARLELELRLIAPE